MSTAQGRPAVIFNNGEAFTQIAFAGEDNYERNVDRAQDFIVPILVPLDVKGVDVLDLLNSGEKRLLKTSVDIDVGGVSVPHRKLSKR